MQEAILVILGLSIVPLALSIFYYVTKPSGRFWRIPTNAWLNPVGMQIVAQKVILLSLISFILFSRFNPEFPGRQLVAYTLYFLLVIAFWWFFILQRRIQLPHEREARKEREKP